MERERLDDHAAFFRTGAAAFRAQHNVAAVATAAVAADAAAVAEPDAAMAEAGSQQPEEPPLQQVAVPALRKRTTTLPPNQLKGEWKPLVDRVAWKLHHNRLRSAANSA